MSELTEKITVNLSVVDLGKIDVIVDQGHYANRTDFVKDAVRRGLDAHEATIDTAIRRISGQLEERGSLSPSAAAKVKNTTVLGVVVFTRDDLEKTRANGERLRLFCVGMAVFASGISASLVGETFESAKVYGSIRGAEEVKKAVRMLPGLVLEIE